MTVLTMTGTCQIRHWSTDHDTREVWVSIPGHRAEAYEAGVLIPRRDAMPGECRVLGMTDACEAVAGATPRDILLDLVDRCVRAHVDGVLDVRMPAAARIEFDVDTGGRDRNKVDRDALDEIAAVLREVSEGSYIAVSRIAGIVRATGRQTEADAEAARPAVVAARGGLACAGCEMDVVYDPDADRYVHPEPLCEVALASPVHVPEQVESGKWEYVCLADEHHSPSNPPGRVSVDDLTNQAIHCQCGMRMVGIVARK